MKATVITTAPYDVHRIGDVKGAAKFWKLLQSMGVYADGLDIVVQGQRLRPAGGQWLVASPRRGTIQMFDDDSFQKSFRLIEEIPA